MVLTNCKYCSYRGHGYEVRGHYWAKHVAKVNVSVSVQEDKDEMTLIVQSHEVKIALPPNMKQIREIRIQGAWSRPRDEE